MKSAAEMWAIVFDSFEWHRGPKDLTAQSALDRVAQKCLGLPERKSFNPGNCSIRAEDFVARDLNELVVYHKRDAPRKMEDPLSFSFMKTVGL